MMVTKDLPRGANWGNFPKKNRGNFPKKKIEKMRFEKLRYEKTESPKITSNVLYELLITSYERFKYFSQTWNLTISKNTNVNKRKSKLEKLNFARKRSKKCNFTKRTQSSSRSLVYRFERFKYVFQYEQTYCPGGCVGGPSTFS